MKPIVFAVVLGGVAAAFLPSTAAAQRCGTAGSESSRLGGLLGGAAGDFISKELRGTGLSNATQRSLRSFLGDAIACALTAEEQKKATDTATEALESGETGDASERSWESDDRDGVRGGTRVVSRTTTEDSDCAVTATFVVDENGEEKSVERQVCRGEEGWV